MVGSPFSRFAVEGPLPAMALPPSVLPPATSSSPTSHSHPIQDQESGLDRTPSLRVLLKGPYNYLDLNPQSKAKSQIVFYSLKSVFSSV